MDVKIANRLAELRKKNGYSQEELADKLGISRQAVSKWERAEASPDTDNLILLAKLYNMSLDDLLDVNKSSEENKTEAETTEKKNKDYVHVGLDGIHVIDGENGDEVHVGFSGIHINEGGEVKYSTYGGMTPKQKQTKKILMAIVWFIAISAYIATGLIIHDWYKNWLILCFVPVLDSLIESIMKKRAKYFAYEILIAIIYVYCGFEFGLWHPLWVIFLTIPFYRLIIDLFNKKDKDADIEITIENKDEKK